MIFNLIIFISKYTNLVNLKFVNIININIKVDSINKKININGTNM